MCKLCRCLLRSKVISTGEKVPAEAVGNETVSRQQQDTKKDKPKEALSLAQVSAAGWHTPCWGSLVMPGEEEEAPQMLSHPQRCTGVSAASGEGLTQFTH